MAESIYTQLENQSVLTPVNGTDFRHSLPSGLFPTTEQFESNDQLIEWAEDMGYTAKLIQKGLQKAIIEVRACFKATAKDIEWTEEIGLKNLDKLEWKTVDKPNQTGGKAILKAKLEAGIDMAKAMKLANLDDSVILASLTPVYGADGANAIMEAISAE